MRTLPSAAVALALLGIVFVLVGVGVGPASVGGIEGAYFTRESGVAAHASVLTLLHPSGLALLSPHDGNLWLGAGIAYCSAALTLFAVVIRDRRRSGSQPAA